MRKTSKKTLFVAFLIIVLTAALSVAAFATDGESVTGPNYATFWSLMPPVLAIALALITKEVYSSLFIGILFGGLLHTGFKPIAAIDTVLNEGFISGVSDAWNAGIFIFLVLLGIYVALMNKAGGSAAFGRWAAKSIKTRRGAQGATFGLGILIFMDDYFNCLTVGSVMRPVTDEHRVSRAKFAYLIDATAAPICMIAPISSWAAAVAGVVEGRSGIDLFIRAIPYNFYSLLTLIFVVAIILMKFDFGPMRLHEKNAIEKGDLITTKPVDTGSGDMDHTPNGKLIDLVLPIVVLIAFCIIGMIYVGGFFDGVDFMTAFGDTDASVGLPWGAMIALMFTIVYLIARRVINFKEAMECITKGFHAMVPALLILTFAVTLKNMTNLLGGADFVYNLMEGSAKSLQNFLPAVIFLVACLLAFSTGTSWGTFGILIPIVTEVFGANEQLMIIGISACLAGAVCGDHCSPISDTTIMASAGAQCDHISHVSTQLPYAITVAAVSFIGFILAGFLRNWLIVFPATVALLIATLFVIQAVTKKDDLSPSV
ncbi:Na+/H+ antiporter NhaC family protein [Clostridiaceae bacterium OttesenSCG-928-D20]|nr:Na+/H+ antiporter NhaC family protein [Clostridiaceae bacterium OttesenSCG-928-D20]